MGKIKIIIEIRVILVCLLQNKLSVFLSHINLKIVGANEPYKSLTRMFFVQL